MKRKIPILIIIIFIIFALSVRMEFYVDPINRPFDYNLDYWLNEKIAIDNIDKSLIYESEYESEYIFLDSRYQFSKEYGNKKMPQKYVAYQLNSDKTMITTITINDPSVSIYGLSMNSSYIYIKLKLLNMGFTYLEYSGRYPSFVKGNYDFTINNSVMILEYISLD